MQRVREDPVTAETVQGRPEEVRAVRRLSGSLTRKKWDGVRGRYGRAPLPG